MDNPFTARLRATDIDRATVASLLDRAYAEGQLSTAEHDVRVQTALGASTRGELLGLLRDLQTEQPAFGSDAGGRDSSGQEGSGHGGSAQDSPVQEGSAHRGSGQDSSGARGDRPTRSDVLIPSRNPNTALIVIIAVIVAVVLIGAITTALMAMRGSSEPSPGPSSGPLSGSSGPPPGPSAGQDAATQTEVSPATSGGDDTDGGGGNGGSGISVYELETTIRGDYLNSEGHIPEAVTCPGNLPGEVGAQVECTVTDHGADFHTVVTVIGATDTEIRYNVSIQGVY